MKKNVGASDRIFRLLLGLTIILLGISAGSWLGLIGLVPIATAAVGWCPLYLPFGISTCKVKAADKG